MTTFDELVQVMNIFATQDSPDMDCLHGTIYVWYNTKTDYMGNFIESLTEREIDRLKKLNWKSNYLGEWEYHT